MALRYWTGEEVRDPIIAQKFNTYRLPEPGCFADYKEKVIDLLAGDDGECGDAIDRC